MGTKSTKCLEIEVLECLPCEPNGLSLPELADGLLGGRGPWHCSRTLAALRLVEKRIGRLYRRIGTDDFGRPKTAMYGIPRDKMSFVRELFREGD